MTTLDFLRQEIATLQAEQTRQRSHLHEKTTLLSEKTTLVLQQTNLIEQKDSLLSEQSATIRKQEEKLAEQQPEINRLIQQAFGRRSERYLESPQQLKSDFGGGPEVTDAANGLQQAVDEKQLVDEAAAAEDQLTGPALPPKKPKKKRDESLPAALPRFETTIDVPDSEKQWRTHGEKTLIGYDTRESLVYIPATLEIRVTKFPKYACPNQPQCKVAQAERPEGLVERDRYDTGIAAEIVTNNLGYHLPLYREQARHWRFIGAAAPRRKATCLWNQT